MNAPPEEPPDTPSSSSLSPSGREARPRPDWRIGLALVLLLVYFLTRTFAGQEKPGSRERTERASKTLEALASAKIAYTLHRWQKGGAVSAAQSKAENTALNQWRTLANSPGATAAEWRRLGILLFLFDRSGGLAAFRHIAAPPPTAPNSPDRRDALESDPLPPAQEIALWEAIYGLAPLTSGQADALRPLLARLRLGWFENLAASRLYARAGKSAESEHAAQAASAAARQPLLLNAGQFLLILAGVAGLISLSLYVLLRHATKEPLLHSRLAPLPLSYQAAMTLFVTYLVVMVAGGLLVSTGYALLWHTKGAPALRTQLLLQLGLYIPVLGLPALLLLRFVRQQEALPPDLSPHAARGNAGEGDDRERPLPSNSGEASRGKQSLRAVLSCLGFRRANPLIEGGIGLAAYVLVLPLFLGVASVSTWIFRHFPAPLNDVQVEMLGIRSDLDKLLLLLVAAVAAPVVEEIMFRGLLYPALRQRWGVLGGAALSAALFAAIHPTIPTGFLPLWLLGFAFAMVYEWRGSLLPNILMHSLHNGLILLTALTVLSG